MHGDEASGNKDGSRRRPRGRAERMHLGDTPWMPAPTLSPIFPRPTADERTLTSMEGQGAGRTRRDAPRVWLPLWQVAVDPDGWRIRAERRRCPGTILLLLLRRGGRGLK